MAKVISIDPGKSKCGFILAETSEKKVYQAIILKSELLENYIRNLITFEDVSKVNIGNGTTSKDIIKKVEFLNKEIITILPILLKEVASLKKKENNLSFEKLLKLAMN